MNEKITFFWGGKFSQWNKSAFEIDGIKYNCCEQYMMAEKAKLFGDKKSFKEIMISTNPKHQKKIGRKIKNFDQKVWDEKCMEIVYKGNYNRFKQNKEDREMLFNTNDDLLVEASPYDKIWGIGLSEECAKKIDQKDWKGENRLGKILTKVRDDLKKEFNKTI